MGPRQWLELMKRAGFLIADFGELNFGISAPAIDGSMWEGTEVYEWYLIKKN